jgi:hypothetical protein
MYKLKKNLTFVSLILSLIPINLENKILMAFAILLLRSLFKKKKN